MMVLHRTWKYNRPDVLWKIGIPVFQRTSGLLYFHVLWRTIINTYGIILPCLAQNHLPNFVSEHLIFFPMFCHQTFVEWLALPLTELLIYQEVCNNRYLDTG